MNYYDVVLVLIPALYVAGWLGAAALNLSATTGFTVSSGASALVILHGMFVNDPTD